MNYIFELIYNFYLRRKNHGFNQDSVEKSIDPSHWVGGDGRKGKLGNEVIKADGQWIDSLPRDEVQRKATETYNCTNYGTNNGIEVLSIAKYRIEQNNSERYTGVNSGTTINGNSPHTAAEAVRSKGMVTEETLPFLDGMTWNEYYSPKPMTKEYLDKGKEWLARWNFQHEWINPTANNLKEYLKYSPIGISVLAWRRGSDGLYYKGATEKDNHWVLLVGYKQGEYWLIYDSYAPHLKKLRWDYNFGFAKRYWLDMLGDGEYIKNLELFNKFIGKYILRVEANGELYRVENQKLIKVNISISDLDLWTEFHKFLRPLITGVTEETYQKFKSVALQGDGIIDETVGSQMPEQIKKDLLAGINEII